MGIARGKALPSAGLIVEEVLSAVLSPREARGTLNEACRIANLDAVPDSPTSLCVFVEGALFTTLSQRFGLSDALTIGEQIRAALALAVRQSSKNEYPDGRAEPSTVPPSKR